MSPVMASSLTTSAPSHARICVADGPLWTWVMSRTRTPSKALRMRQAPLLVHGLVHRPRRVDLGVDPDVDQRRQAALAGPLECRADVGGVTDLLAVTTQHLRELAVPDVAERVADPAAVRAVLLDLAVPDLVHRRVVADDADERQVEAHQRLEVETGQREGAVTEERDDLLVRAGVLGGHHERHADAECPEWTRVHPVPRRLRLHDLAGERDDVAAVADVDRVLGEELVDLVDQAVRVDRRGVGVLTRQALLVGLRLDRAQFLQPRL